MLFKYVDEVWLKYVAEVWLKLATTVDTLISPLISKPTLVTS